MTTATPYQASTEALENRAKEILHTVPWVQPHGFLIACEQSSGRVTFASRNVHTFLDVPGSGILGSCAYDLFAQDANDVVSAFRQLSFTSPDLLSLSFKAPRMKEVAFEIVAHRTGSTVIIEVTPQQGAEEDFNELTQLESVMAGIGTLHQNKSLAEFLQSCATQLQDITGYQRVIIYRFLPDWSGEVIAEATEPCVGARFLSLRFPASDIPVQARALYRTNLLRVIGDVRAAPVSLDALDPGAVLDQSHSILRSPSTMHLGYLQNMGYVPP
jgi:light-regulated signal transduction histidine kinase (bacteriophytochrome)